MDVSTAGSEISIRKNLRLYLEDLETLQGQRLSFLILTLVSISCVIFVVETYTIPSNVRTLLTLIDKIILLCFTLEYGLRFWCAEHKRTYLFSLYSFLDLLSIVPFFFGLDFRFIRLLRWFRVLRLVRFFQGHTIIGYLSSEDTWILTRIGFTLFSIIFIYSGLIYQFEHPVNLENFAHFLDAVYFSVVTMSTVGFGDLTPITDSGRLLTVFMILTGIALIPWQIGELIRYLVKASARRSITCLSCQTALHESDAKYCRICGTQLQTDPAIPLTEVELG